MKCKEPVYRLESKVPNLKTLSRSPTPREEGSYYSVSHLLYVGW